MKEKGFTLIELLIVIAIIGILSSIVLISIGSASNSAKDAANRLELRQFHLIARGLSSNISASNFCNGGDGKKVLDLIYNRRNNIETGYTIDTNATLGCNVDSDTKKWIVAVSSFEKSKKNITSVPPNIIYFCVDSTSNVVRRRDVRHTKLVIKGGVPQFKSVDFKDLYACPD